MCEPILISDEAMYDLLHHQLNKKLKRKFEVYEHQLLDNLDDIIDDFFFSDHTCSLLYSCSRILNATNLVNIFQSTKLFVQKIAFVHEFWTNVILWTGKSTPFSTLFIISHTASIFPYGSFTWICRISKVMSKLV